MDFIKVNGIAIPYPNSLAMMKEPNIASETTAISGSVIYDLNGWKYSDIELSWDYIEENLLKTLLQETDPNVRPFGYFSFTFIDVEEGEKTITAIRKSSAPMKTPIRDANGNRVWKDIRINVTFPTCYK